MEEIRRALATTGPVGLGLIPMGLAFGAVVVQAGFSWWWAPIFSIVVYAGSMEFLAVGLVTGGAGIASSAIAAFMVNFRHIFYGLTFPRNAIRSRAGRAYSTYSLTDEAYAILSSVQARGEPITGRFVLAVQAVCQIFWVVPGIAGALIADALPYTIVGIEFALVALFAVLAIDAFSSNPDWSLPITAVLCTAIGWLISPDQMLVIGLVAYFAVLLLRANAPKLDDWMRIRA